MPEAKNSVTNPELVEALQLLHQQNTPQHQDRVLNLLLHWSALLAPVLVSPVPGQDPKLPQTQQRANIQFQLISTKDGRPFLPAFTDEDELKKFLGDQRRQVMVLHFDQYVEMLHRDPQPHGIVINPLGKSLTLERQAIFDLAKKKQEVAQARMEADSEEEDGHIMIGEPLLYPSSLMAALCTLARDQSAIQTLWVRQMVRPDGVQTYLIVAEHTGVQEEIFPLLQEVIQKYPSPLPVELIPSGTPFAQAAIEDAQPFYPEP